VQNFFDDELARQLDLGELSFSERQVLMSAFDSDYYLEQYPELRGNRLDPFVHYMTIGWRECRDPSPQFRTLDHLLSARDSIRNGTNPFLHWVLGNRPSSPAPDRRKATAAGSRSAVSEEKSEQHAKRTPLADNDCGVIRANSVVPEGCEHLSPADVNRIREVFDEEYYFRNNPEIQLGIGGVFEHYMKIGWKEGRDPNSTFCTAFYLESHPDIEQSGMNPFIHWVLHGMAEQRSALPFGPTFAQTPSEPTVSMIIPSPDDSGSALRWLALVQEALATSPRWWSLLPRSARRPRELRLLQKKGLFHAREYLNDNPDVALSGVDALRHFINHGIQDGRTIRLRTPYSPSVADPSNRAQESPDILRKGRKAFRADNPTILIANHDASRTGAPLVGLNLTRGFDNYNIFIFVGRDGELTTEFLDHSVGVVLGWRAEDELQSLLEHLRNDFDLCAVIINSVESAPWAKIANAAGLPIVSLIHEFSEYTLPVSKSTDLVRLSDRVIVPARLVEQSLQREVQAICSVQAPNIVVRHQGALPYLPKAGDSSAGISAMEIRRIVEELGRGQRHIVLGAGHAQPRKGVDLFVQTAGYVTGQRDDVAFLWVGSGYQPKSDLQYSLWVDQTIERMGLAKTVLFLPSQPNLDACFEASDVFYLPSRLDPYPNVVIDALMASRDVVCFEGATGCAELFGDDVGFRGAAVPYADVQAAGAAIIRLLDQSPRDDFNATKAADYFDFKCYLAVVEGEIEAARANAAANEADAQRLIERRLVDPDYYAPQCRHSGTAARDYVASSRKGLARRNPRLGFSENWWRTLNPGNEGTCPLIAELDAGNERPRTHRCEILTKGAPLPSGSLRVALHLHLHFSELAGEFARRLNMADTPIDVFATVTDPSATQVVEAAFGGYRKGTLRTFVVQNRGRDIGPLLVDLREHLSGYDIVGHLHGKRSLDSGEGVGARWLRFLLDTLIGGDDGVLRQIIRQFEQHADLGLIFAEDGNNVGWSDNWVIAEKVAVRTDPKLDLPSYPFFPLGSMFWARHEALRPLWNANLSHDELPLEPLAYDGTILHAIERVLPAACGAAGFNWQTISVPGVHR